MIEGDKVVIELVREYDKIRLLEFEVWDNLVNQ